MVRFTPREIKENVNISSVSPLREFFVLLGGIFGVIILVYLVLGIALDILVQRMPSELEQKIGKFLSRQYALKKTPDPNEVRIQALLDGLVAYLPENNFNFEVHIQQSPEVNAIALPGGHIVLFSTLLDEVDSENELAMILAHELGHFANSDHLRGLGRGLVLVAISSIVFGVDSTFVNIAQRALITAELKFSRQQEVAADSFALELLYKKYGHAAGAIDFFEHLESKQDAPRFFKFLSTHPHPGDRVTLLNEQIRQNNYTIGEKVPLELKTYEQLE